uniref:non-specific serine/threonine protein kinase n=1 Tax=Tetraselmis sp. GSL018 TaxID=582737 RepID=A0A061QWW9_9CHLO
MQPFTKQLSGGRCVPLEFHLVQRGLRPRGCALSKKSGKYELWRTGSSARSEERGSVEGEAASIQEFEQPKQQPSSADSSWPPGKPLVPRPRDLMQEGDSLGGRYKVLSVLGSGSNAITYKAVGEDGTEVAIKTLSLRGMNDWKQLQLFEREAATLRGLSHPGIPKYLEYFEEETENDIQFYLVQELAKGRSLAELSRSGRRFTEQEAMGVARQLLSVLSYLGDLRPPVVHRDVKPENIILDGEAVRLVDFGGVQEATVWGEGAPLGSTIVGTYGYMAPEQFRGAAQPSSDLYALGGTLLFLLSGQPPSSFPQARLRIDFEGRLSVGGRIKELLNGLLEPLPEDRLTARQALDVLDGKRSKAPERRAGAGQRRGGRTTSMRKPMGSRVAVWKEGRSTVVEIPPSGFGGESLAGGAFAVTWNLFVAYWTVGALAGGGLIFAAFSAPFWVAGAQLLRSSFGSALMSSSLTISPSTWKITKELALVQNGLPSWAGGNAKEVGGKTRDLEGAKVSLTGYINGQPETVLMVFDGASTKGVRKHEFGEGLTYQEKEWLASVINGALDEAKAEPEDDDDYDD